MLEFVIFVVMHYNNRYKTPYDIWRIQMAIDGIDDIGKYIKQRQDALHSGILENNYDAVFIQKIM